MKIANKIKASCLGILISIPLLAGCTEAKHNHTYGNPVWNWTADYSASAVFSCTGCADGKETVNATVTHSVTQAASCTQEEQTTYVASVTFNDKVYNDNKVVVTGGKTSHNFSNWVKKDDAQHQRTCSCGEIEVENHAWGNGVITLAPTHLEEGIMTYHCTKCDAVKTEKIEKTGEHTYENWTKLDDEQHQGTCGCGDVHVENHIWDEGEVTTPATHLKEGIMTYHCTKCDATKTEPVDKLPDHTFGDWEPLDDEQHQRECACGEVEKTDHVWDEGEEIETPTYEAPGLVKYTCTVCGHEVTKEIPQLLHELSREITGMSSELWRALPVDTATEWGNPVEDVNTYGLRNDLAAMKKWSWFTKDGKQDISTKENTQFIAWAGSAQEIGDGVAEQVLANKFTVAKPYLTLRAGTDSNSNIINVRMNIIAEDGTVTSIEPSKTEGNYTALSNSWGQIQQEQWVYGVQLTYDISAYLNNVVTIAIEIDQPSEGNPTFWFNQIGNYDPSLSRTITGFTASDYDALVIDSSTIWGNPIEKVETYGLRNDLDAMKKWSWYTKAGKQDISTKENTQFIAWAGSAQEIGDGVAEQVFANKVTITKPEFIFRAGVDNVGNYINVRLNIIDDDLEVVTLFPTSSSGYVAGSNGWGTITESQWVYGAKLVFDVCEYVGETVAIVIEVDQPAEGNPTIWLDQMGLVDLNKHTWDEGEITTLPTHITEGVKTYHCTECGATRTEPVDKLPDHTFGDWEPLDDKQHQRECACGEVEKADHVWDEGEEIEAPTYEAPGLVKYTCTVCGHEVTKEIPQLLHELSREITGMSSELWRALPVDTATEWGNPVEDVNTYGLRNDLAAMKKWSWFTKDGKQDISTKENTQFIAWAASAQEIGDGVAEQVLANKFTVAKPYLTLRAGTDSNSNIINVRMNIIAEDGTVTSIEPSKTEGNYTALSNSWGQIQQEQWVYGVQLTYDISAYLNDVVTIAIEIDQPAEGNPTFWFNQIGNYAPQLSREITGFTTADYQALNVDTSNEWGNPVEDVNTYGLRNDLAAMKKWSWFTKDGKQDISTKENTQFIAWAASAQEIGDGVAEQVFANKVTIGKPSFTFRAGVDGLGNSINVRVNVITNNLDVVTLTPITYSGYTPGSNGWGTITEPQWVYGCKLVFDMSAYVGETVAIVIEVDQPAEGNPTIWLDQMGLYDFELSRQISCFSKTDYEALTVDNSDQWGDPVEDVNTYGLRNDLAAMKKWSWYTKAGKQDISTKENTQFIAWAASAQEIGDGVAEQVFANKVSVTKSNFEFRAGVDNNGNSINVRINVITDDLVVHTLTPISSTGYTAGSNGWGTITEPQWVYGCKLVFDMSAYVGETVAIVIEVDQPAEGNPTIWLDQMRFVD